MLEETPFTRVPCGSHIVCALVKEKRRRRGLGRHELPKQDRVKLKSRNEEIW